MNTTMSTEGTTTRTVTTTTPMPFGSSSLQDRNWQQRRDLHRSSCEERSYCEKPTAIIIGNRGW